MFPLELKQRRGVSNRKTSHRKLMKEWLDLEVADAIESSDKNYMAEK